MVTKIAAFVLVGSVIALAVGGVTGLTNRYSHGFPFHERMHSRDHVRERIRVKIRSEHREARARHQELRERIENELKLMEQLDPAGVDVGADARARVAGTYAFAADGNPLGKLPWSAHVELKLKPSGQYDLRVRMNIDNERNEEASWGRYRVVGDRLILYSGHDHDAHELRIAGDQLIFGSDWKQKLALKAVGVDDAVMKRVTE